MKLAEIEALAHKIQLVIQEEEMPVYLEIFTHLEKLLTSFKSLKISKKVKLHRLINPLIHRLIR